MLTHLARICCPWIQTRAWVQISIGGWGGACSTYNHPDFFTSVSLLLPDQDLIKKVRNLDSEPFLSCHLLAETWETVSPLDLFLAEPLILAESQGKREHRSHCLSLLFAIWISFTSSPYLACAWEILETGNLPASSLMNINLGYEMCDFLCYWTEHLTYLKGEWFWRSLLCTLII